MREIGVVACGIMLGLTLDVSAGAWMVEPPACQFDRRIITNQVVAARSALMYINHLNYVVAKLGSMNDLVVLQQEYENLTDDNLNLESIRDETTVRLIVQLMDQLKNLQKSKLEGAMAQVAFERAKRDAIWKAIPQPAVFLGGGNPHQMAIAIAGSVLTSIQNYYNAKAEARRVLDNAVFDIAKNRLDYINEINKELFFSQWRLMKDYGLSDADRITRDDSRLFLGFADVLNDMPKDDANCSRLVHNIYKTHEKDMRGLPFYWITRASAAHAVLDCQADITYCCERYFELYRNTVIVRKDMDACAMALLYVTQKLKDTTKPTEEQIVVVRRWLSFVEDTCRIPEWRVKFAVAQIYGCLGLNEERERLLRSTLAEVYACIRVWEKSNSRKNIFRMTPALEMALGGEDMIFGSEKDGGKKVKATVGWPQWDEESKRLVPYEGYCWLTGALYEMGYQNVFADMSCGISKVGEDYLTGRVSRNLPTVTVRRNCISVTANAAWEGEGAEVRLFWGGIECKRTTREKGSWAVVEFENPQQAFHGDIVVSVRTAYGILANFRYDESGLAKEPKYSVKYPWSL